MIHKHGFHVIVDWDDRGDLYMETAELPRWSQSSQTRGPADQLEGPNSRHWPCYSIFKMSERKLPRKHRVRV